MAGPLYQLVTYSSKPYPPLADTHTLFPQSWRTRAENCIGHRPLWLDVYQYPGTNNIIARFTVGTKRDAQKVYRQLHWTERATVHTFERVDNEWRMLKCGCPSSGTTSHYSKCDIFKGPVPGHLQNKDWPRPPQFELGPQPHPPALQQQPHPPALQQQPHPPALQQQQLHLILKGKVHIFKRVGNGWCMHKCGCTPPRRGPHYSTCEIVTGRLPPDLHNEDYHEDWPRPPQFQEDPLSSQQQAVGAAQGYFLQEHSLAQLQQAEDAATQRYIQEYLLPSQQQAVGPGQGHLLQEHSLAQLQQAENAATQPYMQENPLPSQQQAVGPAQGYLQGYGQAVTCPGPSYQQYPGYGYQQYPGYSYQQYPGYSYEYGAPPQQTYKQNSLGLAVNQQKRNIEYRDVFLQNIPFSVDYCELKEWVERTPSIHKPISVKLQERGKATLSYGSQVGAQEAVKNLDGQNINGKSRHIGGKRPIHKGKYSSGRGEIFARLGDRAVVQDAGL